MSDLAIILSERIDQLYEIKLSFEGKFNQDFLSASHYNPYHHVFEGIDIELGKTSVGRRKDFYFLWKGREADCCCKSIAAVYSDFNYQTELLDASILHLKKMHLFVDRVFLPKDLGPYVGKGHLDLLESNGKYSYLGENLELLSTIHILKNKRERETAWDSLLLPDLI
ncbi:MAG: hypothetical protein ABIA37_02990 [Candidatus Woesearchaeota archaeon]